MKSKPVKKLSKKEQSIVSSIKKGNGGRFSEIEILYHDKILFYLWHLVGSKEEAEDILQNVFLKVYKTMDRFDNRRKLSSWIYRIAHNEAVNFLKQKSKRPSISWEDVVSIKDRLRSFDQEDSPQERWIRAERRTEVRHALNALPARYREVLLLRFYLEKSYEEISEIIGHPIGTVGTLISRAKKRLVTQLKKR